jgi:hypothetical protein
MSGRLPDILEVFTGLESDRTPWGYPYFLAGPWITADPTLPGLDLENAEPAQLDPVTALHGEAHGIEDRVDRHLGLHLGDVGRLRDFTDNVDLDHARESPDK